MMIIGFVKLNFHMCTRVSTTRGATGPIGATVCVGGRLEGQTLVCQPLFFRSLNVG